MCVCVFPRPLDVCRSEAAVATEANRLLCKQTCQSEAGPCLHAHTPIKHMLSISSSNVQALIKTKATATTTTRIIFHRDRLCGCTNDRMGIDFQQKATCGHHTHLLSVIFWFKEFCNSLYVTLSTTHRAIPS